MSDTIPYELWVNDAETQHRRILREFDPEMLDLAAYGNKWRSTPIAHPTGAHPFQGFSNRCAAEAVLNVAEALGLPLVSAQKVYERARQLDLEEDFNPGTWLWAAAEAYCRMTGGKTKWAHLPRTSDAVGRWINCKSPVAVAIEWTERDSSAGWGKILEHGGRTVGGHALCLYGVDPAYTWRRFPLIGKKRTADTFLVENSNSAFPLTRMPVSRVDSHGIEALILLP